MIWHLSPENLSLHAHSNVLAIAVQVPPNRHGPDIHKSKIQSCVKHSHLLIIFIRPFIFATFWNPSVSRPKDNQYFLRYFLLSMFISPAQMYAAKKIYLLKCMLTSLKNVAPSPWNSSHQSPLKYAWQVQLTSFPLSIRSHVPPFWQGFESHLSVRRKRINSNSKVNLGNPLSVHDEAREPIHPGSLLAFVDMCLVMMVAIMVLVNSELS